MWTRRDVLLVREAYRVSQVRLKSSKGIEGVGLENVDSENDINKIDKYSQGDIIIK